MTVIPGSNRIMQDVVLADPITGGAYDASGLFPNNATSVNGGSGDVVAATAAFTMPAVVGKTNYLAGFQLSGGGATAATVVQLTITGLLGGTLTYNVPVPAGATLGLQPIVYQFYPPLPASGPNTPIVVSCPSLGAGNLHSSLNVQGFVR